MEEKKSKRTYIHFHWLVDIDSYEWSLVIAELLDGQVVISYVAPIATKPSTICHIYPYIRN